MSKCDFNKLCNFIETTFRHGFSPANLLHIFRTSFLKNTSGWLLLWMVIESYENKAVDYGFFFILPINFSSRLKTFNCIAALEDNKFTVLVDLILVNLKYKFASFSKEGKSFSNSLFLAFNFYYHWQTSECLI